MNIGFHIVAVITVTTILSACSVKNINSRHDNGNISVTKTNISKELGVSTSGNKRHGLNAEHSIKLGKTASLRYKLAWPIKQKGHFHQRLKSKVNGKSKVIMVHLALLPNLLEAVAYNDIAGFLYQINWTPKGIKWQSSKHVPVDFQPDYMVADFLLTNLPIKELSKILIGATVQDRDLVRIIRVDGKVIRKIIRKDPSNNGFWRNVSIYNPIFNYHLKIDSVEQE